MKGKIENIKSKITLENMLCIFIILCPLLDMSSFLFRKFFSTSFSLSTIIRPIIPIVVIMYIFFKDRCKLRLICVGVIYGIYALIHLYLFNEMRTGISYGTTLYELQYIVNYSFMILNLFIFTYVFYIKNNNVDKIKKSVLISICIYMLSIYISIFTKTASSTYIEGIGQKGWFESGNSIGAILILSMFILYTMIRDIKTNKIVITLIVFTGVYLMTMLGTRVGLYGFIFVTVLYASFEIIMIIKNKVKLSKKTIIGATCLIILVLAFVLIKGSSTLQRRKYLQEEDIANNFQHVTLDIMNIKETIDKGDMSEETMSKESQNAIIKLYEYASEHNIKGTDRRTQQLVFNYYQLLYQKDIRLIAFGNGYLNNYAELTLEMEIPALLINFGIFGFILYFMPFLCIVLYATYVGIRNIKKIDVQYLTLLAGAYFVFIISFVTSSVFFNASTTIIIIAIYVLLLNKLRDIKKVKENSSLRKVVFGITSLSIGGAERVLVDLVNDLSKTDNLEITVFTLYGKGDFENQINKKVNIKSLYSNSYDEMSKLKKIMVSMRLLLFKNIVYSKFIKNKFDVEIAFLEGPITRLFSVKNENTKKIAWVHTDITKIFGNGLKSKVKARYDKSIYDKYNKIIFVSKESLEKFEKAYPAINTSKLQVIYNYINKENVINKMQEKMDITYDMNTLNIVTVARLVNEKGLDRLVRVHKRLINENLQHKIYVIGDGQEKENLQQMVEDNEIEDTFKILGKKENPYPYIKSADAFCLLSYYEGYPMSIIEAKLLNKYIIITNTSAKETLEGYKKCMILENDEESIYKGLKEFIINKDKYLSNAENKYIEYENKNILKEVEDVIIKI